MKVLDIATRVRNIAGDTSALQITDAMILDWINDGVRQCAIDNDLLQKKATSATVVGDKTYALPTDILKLHSVDYEGSKLRIVTLQEYQDLVDSNDTSSGTPSMAFIWVKEINLYPTPSAVGTLTVNYIYDPANLSMAAGPTFPDVEPELPTSYHSRLVDYCLAQVAQQDGDLNLYSVKMQEFITGVQQLKDDPEYQDDQYPFMGVSARDMGDGYWFDE